MSLSVPESKKACQNCAECVIFVLATQEAQHQSRSGAKNPQGRGTTKAQLNRILSSEFSSFGEDSLWQEVIDALCKSGVIANLNAEVNKTVRSFLVQPLYVLSSSIKRSNPVEKLVQTTKEETKAQKRRKAQGRHRNAKKSASRGPKKGGK